MSYEFIKEAEIMAGTIGVINPEVIEYLATKLEISYTQGQLAQLNKDKEVLTNAK